MNAPFGHYPEGEAFFSRKVNFFRMSLSLNEPSISAIEWLERINFSYRDLDIARTEHSGKYNFSPPVFCSIELLDENREISLEYSPRDPC